MLTKSDSARAKLPPTPRSGQWKVLVCYYYVGFKFMVASYAFTIAFKDNLFEILILASINSRDLQMMCHAWEVYTCR